VDGFMFVIITLKASPILLARRLLVWTYQDTVRMSSTTSV